ncbi:MAG: nitronate monooxygenase [Deltaproteobacteria bacterium]|nr:nitronate monooxygenase [Candidatus Zymogenaceae bacterium]
MIASRLLPLLGIRYPILQGGMARVSRAALVAAVSEAGGLGIIGAGLMEPDELKDEIGKTRNLTSRPFGVNLILTAPLAEEKLAVVVREGVRVLTVGAGNAGPIVRKAEGADLAVIPVVASVSLAVRMERAGAAAVIAEGYESGGHVGELTTMALVAMVSRSVSIPVIAAGGIADGRGLASALMLGAEGVQMGTVFCTADECSVHERWKERIINAGDRDTIVTGRSTGHPVRIIRNRLARKLLDMEKRGGGPEEILRFGEGALERAVQGDVEEGSVMAGQISGLVGERKSAGKIIDDVMAEAQRTIRAVSERITEERR